MAGKLTITRGYSGSGKSTWAREQQAKNTNVLLVSRDDIRRDYLGYKFKTKTDRASEQAVTQIEQAIVKTGLRCRKHVIVHDTNLVLRFAREWAALAQREGAEFHVADFEVDKTTCVARNLLRPEAERVPAQVILEQSSKWPIKQWQEVTPKPRTHDNPPARFEPDENLPPAIIVDLDGTLCIKGDRDIYDASLCHRDTRDEAVSTIAEWAWADDYEIIFMSGRGEEHRVQTEAWLEANGWPLHIDGVHGPFMRPEGDRRPDFKVKADLFEEHVRGRFNVKFALDDRDQIVDLWRGMGIKTLQVDYGDF